MKKRVKLRARIARARRNVKFFYFDHIRYQGGGFTHSELKSALSEKHLCDSLIKPFDR
ncbi:hypothetical protein ACLI07_23690 (plasmid) [Providencia huaxiensis]|nr:MULTISPECIES: hypothetical protein [Providencia]ELB1214759.1 hypothetical protein [Proteus mirabilis]HAZ7974721.1 hypothetical protein [Escherichia coli]ELR5094201.1 hypothetical protein [Providencia rettgeri]ELR5243235.1 hypothetical protein [Providencia rettgeri]MBJ9973706.1 hypothetical protein [Providencia rettgeri]